MPTERDSVNVAKWFRDGVARYVAWEQTPRQKRSKAEWFELGPRVCADMLVENVPARALAREMVIRERV